MIARTHDLAAITALSVVFLSVPMPQITLSTVILSVLANLIGGIVPDIDQPTAPFWRNLPVGGFFGRFLTKMLGGHRFLTHSLLGVAVLGYLVYLMLGFFHPVMPKVNIDIVWWAFMIGILSHLVIDTFNKEGVPWLLPIPIKFGLPPIKAWRVTTDSWVENWLILPGLLVFNFVLYFQNYQHLLDLIHNNII
ncbi:MAG: metal-dependent hydrolase [Candidatus Saccharimonadales bacterium]